MINLGLVVWEVIGGRGYDKPGIGGLGMRLC